MHTRHPTTKYQSVGSDTITLTIVCFGQVISNNQNLFLKEGIIKKIVTTFAHRKKVQIHYQSYNLYNRRKTTIYRNAQQSKGEEVHPCPIPIFEDIQK